MMTVMMQVWLSVDRIKNSVLMAPRARIELAIYPLGG